MDVENTGLPAPPLTTNSAAAAKPAAVPPAAAAAASTAASAAAGAAEGASMKRAGGGGGGGVAIPVAASGIGKAKITPEQRVHNALRAVLRVSRGAVAGLRRGVVSVRGSGE